MNFGAYSLCNFINFTDKGIPFLMTENIRHNYINWNIRKYVDNKSHKMLYKSHCHKGELLITMAGEYLGRVAVYDKDEICSSNQAIAKVNLKEGFNPYVISTFLNSKHGQNQINRFRTITGQPNINMSLIKSLLIPEFSESISNNINDIVKESEYKKQQSKQTYAQAQNLLLEEIGLQNFTPSKEPVNIKSFKDSFGASGRLDAEYYQKKYDIIEGIIQSYKNGFSTIGKSIEYLKTGEYSSSYIKKNNSNNYYLRNTNISNGKITPNDNYAIPSNQFKTKACLNEILTSRVGTIGLFGVINKELINSVYSDNVLCFKLKDTFNSLVYSILFSTKPYQLLLEKLAGGSVQPLITQTSLKLLPIPIIDYKKQQQIADLIEQSFRLKKQSEHLLEVAKRAVEIAIEENEEVALNYINQETK